MCAVAGKGWGGGPKSSDTVVLAVIGTSAVSFSTRSRDNHDLSFALFPPKTFNNDHEIDGAKSFLVLVRFRFESTERNESNNFDVAENPIRVDVIRYAFHGCRERTCSKREPLCDEHTFRRTKSRGFLAS